MLGIDTILGTVCIEEMSIYSEVLANVGRWPAFFFVPGNRGSALKAKEKKNGNKNTAVTIDFYRYCRFLDFLSPLNTKQGFIVWTQFYNCMIIEQRRNIWP